MPHYAFRTKILRFSEFAMNNTIRTQDTAHKMCTDGEVDTITYMETSAPQAEY